MSQQAIKQKWIAYVRKHGFSSAVTKARNAGQNKAAAWLQRLQKFAANKEREAEAAREASARSAGAVGTPMHHSSARRSNKAARVSSAARHADGSIDPMLKEASVSEAEVLSFGTDPASGPAGDAEQQAAADAEAEAENAQQSKDATSSNEGSSSSEPASSSSSLEKATANLLAARTAVAQAEQQQRAAHQQYQEARKRAAYDLKVEALDKAEQAVEAEQTAVAAKAAALTDEQRHHLLQAFCIKAKRDRMPPEQLEIAKLLQSQLQQEVFKADFVTLPDGSLRYLGRTGPLNKGNTLADGELAIGGHADECEGLIGRFHGYIARGEPVPPAVAELYFKKIASGEYADWLMQHASESQPGLGLGKGFGAVLPGLGNSPKGGEGSRIDPTVLKTIKQPGPFTGTKADTEPIRRWLTSMSHYLTITRVPQSLGVGVAVTYLRGEAQVFWFSVQQNIKSAGEDPASWEVFKKYMVMGFGALDPEITARDKAESLRQTGSVEEYARQLISYFTQLVTEPMAERDQIRVFHHGLKPSVAASVQVDPVSREPWTSLHEAVQYAIRWDNANKHSLSRSAPPAMPPGVLRKIGKLSRGGFQPYHDPEGRREQLRNGDFGGKGKFVPGKRRRGGGGNGNGKSSKGADGAGSSKAAAAKATQEERQRRFRLGLCLECGEKGHMKHQCPQLQKK